MSKLRTFLLYRKEDMSGISGVGVVGEGCQFSNGKCVLVWTVDLQSVAVYDSVEDLIAIHGHDGNTEVRWTGIGKKLGRIIGRRD